MRDSSDSHDPAYGRVRRAKSKRHRTHYDEETFAKRDWHLPRLAAADADYATDGLAEGDRWSTWDQSTPLERGPRPHPKWLVTELAAVDTELGIMKTGKEADVYLLRRGVPGTQRTCLLAAKRYREADHRLFHRDAGYLEGRRTRDTRVTRAAANRTAFGKQAIAGQWANAEFAALRQLYTARVPVPYPVQITGTEVLLEFIGDPVEQPAGRVPVPLRGEQAGPTGSRHAAPQQEHVGFLACLYDAQLVVDGGELGYQPLRVRPRAAFRRGGLVPGRPAIAFSKAVGRVVRVRGGEPGQVPGALGEGLLVVMLALPLALGAAVPAIRGVVGICAVAHE